MDKDKILPPSPPFPKSDRQFLGPRILGVDVNSHHWKNAILSKCPLPSPLMSLSAPKAS